MTDHVHVAALGFIGLLRRLPRRFSFYSRAVTLEKRRFGGSEREGERF